ncbi:MAG: type II toxin-antitoxin system RelE/ParE family toxin [Anaerobutyricum sp.]|nr:type II toxin-antitoxin system RelE/ParE family toxin [Anaerobutyricum sp.]
MIFDVSYSAKARQDLRDIFEYIAYELLAPEAAAGQTEHIMKVARSLEQMPMRHRLYEEEPWRSQGLRVLPVDNYLVFYLPDETSATVSIIRIMYGGRDIDKQLNDN